MRLLFVLTFFSLTACVGPSTKGALTVPEVTSNMIGLDGRTVTVRGWLDVCQHLSCGLFSSKQAATSRHYGEDMLSIASKEDFDRRAVGRGPAEVVIVARVSADCRTKYVCTDRAHELEPIAIRFLGKK